MVDELPLTSLISRLLVAFTIELDNEAEHRMPHRTTDFGPSDRSSPGPWLVSYVMWSNCMQFVPEEGASVREVERLARARTNWNGMERWGYVMIEPDPAHRRARPPRSDWIVRATPEGRAAQRVWRPLGEEIEARWRKRFEGSAIARLREGLVKTVARAQIALPDCLPILGYGLFSRLPDFASRQASEDSEESISRLSLHALLSRCLLLVALAFESQSPLSLAIAANLLRVLDEEGLPVRDLPRRTGASKEALRMAFGILEKSADAAMEQPEKRGAEPRKGTIARLTEKGARSRKHCERLLALIEERWRAGLGERAFDSFRACVKQLSDWDDPASHLHEGLEPYPDGWRARAASRGLSGRSLRSVGSRISGLTPSVREIRADGDVPANVRAPVIYFCEHRARGSMQGVKL